MTDFFVPFHQNSLSQSAAVLFYAGLGFALAYLPLAPTRASWPRSVLKTLPLLCFAGAGYLAQAPAFLIGGLFLSALGDYGLSRDGASGFLYGLSAFALAHLLYILHFLARADASVWEVFATSPLPAIAVIGLILSTEIWLTPHTGALTWPVRVYALVIGAMGLTSLLLPFGASTVGAGLFLLSDLILAIELFRLDERHPKKRLAGHLVWGIYVAGQALILSGGLPL